MAAAPWLATLQHKPHPLTPPSPPPHPHTPTPTLSRFVHLFRSCRLAGRCLRPLITNLTI